MGDRLKGFMSFERKAGASPRLQGISLEFDTQATSQSGNMVPSSDSLPPKNRTETSPQSALGSSTRGTFDITTKELECARRFNFTLPQNIPQAVQMLEKTVNVVMGTRKNLILLYDEELGTYYSLNDRQQKGQQPRELTLVSDHFIQDLVGSQEVLHTYIYTRDTLLGIVAVADKLDGTAFSLHDEMILEALTKYLGTKIEEYQNLKVSLSLPFVQNVLLEISNRLIAAVDEETILSGVLESLTNRLGLEVCQYVGLSAHTGAGEVLLEHRKRGVKNYFHDEKRKTIKDFAALISLFSSIARKIPYLQIQGDMLGDKSMAELFGVKETQSTLILPIKDVASNTIRGVLNLFQSDEPGPMREEVIQIATEVSILVSLALTRARALEKALAIASSDELTGLTNRRGFYDRFEIEVERSRRNQTALSVAMIDVDHFKQLNDTFGHFNGDLVLQTLAEILLKNVRKSDVVCRFGGEEFTLLLPDTSLKAAADLMDRIRRKVQKCRVVGSQGALMKITISTGVAPVTTSQGLTRPLQEVVSEALAQADEQLYRAKESGRNQVCVATMPNYHESQSLMPFLQSS